MINQIILEERARFIAEYPKEKPKALFLDMKGMHDLWQYFEETELSKLLDRIHGPAKFLGLEIKFDSVGITPRIE